MIPSSVLIKLATLGLSADEVEAVASMLSEVEAATLASAEATQEKSKEKARERWKRWKLKHDANVGKRLPTDANVGKRLARVEGSSSPTEIARQEETKNARDARSCASEFEIWYRRYPHKIGRGQAERAFVAARKIASLEDLIAGVDRYIASKPPDVNWRNPATWLNGKGWLDEPAQPTPTPRASGPPSSRRNYLDVAKDRWSGVNGTAGVFGDHGDAQRVPSGQREPGLDDADLRGGLARRVITGGH